MRNIIFSNSALKTFIEWSQENPKIHKKIANMILEITREPFIGIGKPEPLKGNMSGLWSRRIDINHRLVYKVNDTSIEIISCKFHY